MRRGCIVPVVERARGEVGAGGRTEKRVRQRLIRQIVDQEGVTSQHELVSRLAARGVHVTQATVSRDVTELGLVKVSRGGRHIYAAATASGPATSPDADDRLRRILADYPLRIGRSGLTLLLLSEPGTAGAIAQAIDASSLDEQEGTLAGDDTILVLFADDARLRAWRARFEALLPAKTSMGYAP
jgi:transcriptional regulator of arginine metabolism